MPGGDKMTSIQFVVHPLPGTQEQLAEKLKSVADKLNKYGLQGEFLCSHQILEGNV